MDDLINIVNPQSSSTKTDKKKHRKFAPKVPICKHTNISKIDYENWSKDETITLLVKFYNRRYNEMI